MNNDRRGIWCNLKTSPKLSATTDPVFQVVLSSLFALFKCFARVSRVEFESRDLCEEVEFKCLLLDKLEERIGRLGSDWAVD